MRQMTFCQSKYRSMLIAGTFTMAVNYLMLLCDHIIAGLIIGSDAVSAINLISPLIGINTFLSLCITGGISILWTRAVGAMDKERADRIFGLGVISTAVMVVLVPLILIAVRNFYFEASGITGPILAYARDYYVLLPLSAALMLVCTFLEQTIYSDGDEGLQMLSYVAQIGGNIGLSVLFAGKLGIFGIMLGTVTGTAAAVVILSLHFLKKTNTLRFAMYFSWKDLWNCFRYSVLDAVNYPLWGITNYILISYISRRFGERYLVVLAVVMSLIELSVVFDGIGMAVQPLIGVYIGENNHLMIRRLMKSAVKTAVWEGIAATLAAFFLAAWFARLFGVTDPEMVSLSVTAIRIVCLTFTAASLFALEVSYYLYIDHILFAVTAICLKDGVMNICLPLLFSAAAGFAGLWIGFAAVPVLGVIVSLLLLRRRVGRKRFPWLLEGMNNEIIVYDSVLSPETISETAQKIETSLGERGYSPKTAMQAALFAEEISATLREKNGKKKVLVESSLIFEEESVRLIIRDSGKNFDITDPDLAISGLSTFVVSSLLNHKKEKNYTPTTGYNRNTIRFARDD